MFSIFFKKKEQKNNSKLSLSRSYYQDIGKAVWTDRNYVHLAEESYIKNVIANRCISIITKSASSVKIHIRNKNNGEIVENHNIMNLLKKPNPLLGQTDFFETIYAHKLISGNVFIEAVFTRNSKYINPQELFILRPDIVTVLVGNNSIPVGYKYKVNNTETIFKINQINGKSEILHIKNFYPTNDWYRLSQVE